MPERDEEVFNIALSTGTGVVTRSHATPGPGRYWVVHWVTLSREAGGAGTDLQLDITGGYTTPFDTPVRIRKALAAAGASDSIQFTPAKPYIANVNSLLTLQGSTTGGGNLILSFGYSVRSTERTTNQVTDLI